jgi:rubrerythrin
MDSRERLSALEVALNNEMREHEFYLKNADRTKNALGKQMFARIAEDELEHYERLKRLHAEWEKQGRWPQDLPLEVKGTRLQGALVNTIKNVNAESTHDHDDLEAIRTAIDFEAKGEAFYHGLRDAVTDQKEKAFFDLLSQIEHEHYLSLQDAEEFLVDPAGFYRRMEHLNVDGG